MFQFSDKGCHSLVSFHVCHSDWINIHAMFGSLSTYSNSYNSRHKLDTWLELERGGC